MSEQLKPGWRWESFEKLKCTVVTAPNGLEYELRAGDIAHPRAQRLFDAMFSALTTSQPAQAGEVDERAAFEKAARQEGCGDFRRVGDAYSDRRTLRCYRIWQKARASLPTQPAAQAEAHPLASRCYTMSEKHLSGHRLILGFETMEAAQTAHTWIANLGKPAAQATPEPLHLFEFWWESHMPQATQAQAWKAWKDAQDSKGAAIEAAQQATPEPVRLAGSVHEDNARILQNILDELRMIIGLKYGESIVAAVRALTATPDVPETDFGNMVTQQATPEPVGEVDQIDIDEDGQAHAWVVLHDNVTIGDKLYHRPAPGVPEGFDVQAHVATGGGHEYPLITVRDTSTQVGEDVFPDEHPVIYGLLSALLAAAQAKGADK